MFFIYFLSVLLSFSSFTEKYTIQQGPSFDWKHHNPELQAILDELREKEAKALENIRSTANIPIAEWKLVLEKFKNQQRSLCKFFSCAKNLDIPPKLPTVTLPGNVPIVLAIAASEFCKQLRLVGICPGLISIIDINEEFNTETFSAASTDGKSFFVNIKHPIWLNNHKTYSVNVLRNVLGNDISRKTIVAHEIGHFLEGHSLKRFYIQQKISKSLVNILADLDHSSELIADLLLAIYHPPIACRVYKSFALACVETEDRKEPYSANKEVFQYMQRIVTAHEKELYNKISFVNKFRLYIAKLLGWDDMYFKFIDEFNQQ